MNIFNNKMRFSVKNNNVILWIEDNQTVDFEPIKHGSTQFKGSTKNYEFIKCPVNPQQTSFRYIKLSKKSQTFNQVYDNIYMFYNDYQFKPWPCKMENLMDIEQDNTEVISSLIAKAGNTCGEWRETLGTYTKFKEIVEETHNGYKCYRVIFTHE